MVTDCIYVDRCKETSKIWCKTSWTS